MWKCECDCGNICVVEGRLLRSHTTGSCGCLSQANPVLHGCSHSRTYSCWCAMKKRVLNKKHAANSRYRALGVCERWLVFTNFLADMGHCPSAEHSIERANNTKGYEPGNCCWATRTEQSRNRKDNVWLEYNDQRLILSDWAKLIGLTPAGLASRLKKMSVAEALTKPVKTRPTSMVGVAS